LIFSVVAFPCLYLNLAICQEIGAYRTVGSGNFGNISIWQIYDGASWSAATLKPCQANDIYIEPTHLLTLYGNEEVKSLFINSDSGADQKLNLNSYNLDIYGSLQAFNGYAPGVPTGSHPSTDWIGNSISSTLTFKGVSRVIIPDGAWSAQSTNSRYAVIFDPGEGIELICQRAFKALKFTIRSGTVNQKINITSNPNVCATFSFNTNSSLGTDEFGDFIIENGAKLITQCSSDILYRSGTSTSSRPASLFNLQAGAELILLGSSPQIEAASLQLNGKVTFLKNVGTQTFLSKSYSSSAIPIFFHTLEIHGSQNVNLPPAISVSGNMVQVGSGSFITNTTHLTLTGNHEQLISGFSMKPLDLTVDKTGSSVILQEDLTVSRNLTMLRGKVDFQGKKLIINTSNSGTYAYSGGSWEKVSTVTFENTPSALNASNASFPFGDRYQGGIRKVQFLGEHVGGDLSINYTEYKGADSNPGFNDNDINNTPILYRLYSYFQFSGLASSSNALELRISADNLIVDKPEDLRLVCAGYAAPGSHIESSDTINLWAIRKLTFDEAIGKNFTVGSFRTLSILPVTWLSLTAKVREYRAQIIWSVAQEKANEKFEIYRATDPLENWTKIGEILGKGDSEIPVAYKFMDESIAQLSTSYYQIRQVDYSGKWAWSRVVRLENELINPTDQLSIFPNPYTFGKISVIEPKSFNLEKTQVTIFSMQGFLISTFTFNEVGFSEKLEILNPGLYLITFSNAERSFQTKWIKRY